MDGQIIIYIYIYIFFFFFIYTIIQSITSSEMCSLHLTHPSAHTLGAVGSRCCSARGAVGVRCLAQGSHLSHGQFLPEPMFEPTTLGYKFNALSIRPRLPLYGYGCFMQYMFIISETIVNIVHEK